jgi:hypothetical protein
MSYCLHRFLASENQDTFFATRDRQRVAYEILAKTPYGKKKRAEIGIDRLVEEEVYAAAFPLHDVSAYHVIFKFFIYHIAMFANTSKVLRVKLLQRRQSISFCSGTARDCFY